MKTVYRVSFSATAEQLPTILAVMCREVTDFNITEVNNSIPVSRKRINGGRPQALMKIFLDNTGIGGEISTLKLGAIFEKHGYHASSASAFCSKARRNGYIEPLEAGGYRRIR